MVLPPLFELNEFEVLNFIKVFENRGLDFLETFLISLLVVFVLLIFNLFGLFNLMGLFDLIDLFDLMDLFDLIDLFDFVDFFDLIDLFDIFNLFDLDKKVFLNMTQIIFQVFLILFLYR